MTDIDLKGFTGSALGDLKIGTPNDFTIQGPVEFELSTVTTKNKSGKIDVKVVSANSNVNVAQAQKIKFTVYSRNDLDLKKKIADIKLTNNKAIRETSILHNL